jgi:hypothetical protein
MLFPLTTPRLYSLQFIILAILATRMHLYLWHVDRHLRSPDVLTLIPMTDVAFHLGSGSAAAPVVR